MYVYDIKVIEPNTTVTLGGCYGDQVATVLHYEEDTYPCTYTVELANGTIETGVAHAALATA